MKVWCFVQTFCGEIDEAVKVYSTKEKAFAALQAEIGSLIFDTIVDSQKDTYGNVTDNDTKETLSKLNYQADGDNMPTIQIGDWCFYIEETIMDID